MDFVKCHDCMKNAPHKFCCKEECGKREECKVCEAECKGTECPNSKKYSEQ